VCVVQANGEIYNHEALRKTMKPHEYHTQSDCEVIAHLVRTHLFEEFWSISMLFLNKRNFLMLVFGVCSSMKMWARRWCPCWTACFHLCWWITGTTPSLLLVIPSASPLSTSAGDLMVNSPLTLSDHCVQKVKVHINSYLSCTH
jgi:hypothetical protein